jgi:SAM-dependent methyltransferase
MSVEPEEQRAQMLERWERTAAGWGRRADDMRAFGMPVAVRMIERLRLHPGLRVLELAAGPGEVGFLAAELVEPGGSLVSSDGAEAMLEVARARAQQRGLTSVAFRRLELEWIDAETASFDRVLCRWGLMLLVDPGAAASEMRRVLAPGGRVAVAVWDDPAANPWATIQSRALVELGHAERPDPNGPGMFALSAPGRLQELLESAGFVEVVVEQVELERVATGVDDYVAESVDVSQAFADAVEGMSEVRRAELDARIATLAEPYTAADGSIRLPGRSLVASAAA